MKKLLFILLLFSAVGYSQNPAARVGRILFTGIDTAAEATASRYMWMHGAGDTLEYTYDLAGTPTVFRLFPGTLTSGHIVTWNGRYATLAAPSGLGIGTVTSFSAGDLSPLFTTSEATVTTTPALSFSATDVSSRTFLGRNAAGTGAYSFVAQPQWSINGGSATYDSIRYANNSYVTWSQATNALSATVLKADFSAGTFAVVSKRITLSLTDSLFEVRAPFDMVIDSMGSIQTSITAVTWNAYNGASAMLSSNASATSSFAIAAGTQNNTVTKNTIISTSVRSITGSGNLFIQLYCRRTAQ
jgi:hypothetical protein